MDFGISVAVTASQFGPTICGTGQKFSPLGDVKIEMTDIPGLTGIHIAAQARADANGTFSFTDGSLNRYSTFCTNQQVQIPTTVVATDLVTGAATSATFSSQYFCTNATVSTDLNGGCH
jgi:hypothetical protein